MTVSQLRRRIDALKRRFAPELTIIKIRRIAEAVVDDLTPAEPPDPADVIQRFAKAGCRLTTFASLRRYLNGIQSRGDVPRASAIVVNLIPWAGNDRYLGFLQWDLPTPAH